MLNDNESTTGGGNRRACEKAPSSGVDGAFFNGRRHEPLDSERGDGSKTRRPVHPPGLVPRASVGPPDHQ